MIFNHFKIIDLTHVLSPDIPTWNGALGYNLKNEEELYLLTSSGTHIDSPSMKESLGGLGGESIANLSLEKLLVSACVIDVSKKAHAYYQVSVEDIKEFESSFGIIPKNSLVIFYTGWSLHWSDAKAYRNVNEKGSLCFPTIAPEVALLLLERDVVGIGVDLFSPDPLDSDFPVHKILFEKGKYIIENMANCFLLPPIGSYVLALPIKLPGQEAPARVIAFVS